MNLQIILGRYCRLKFKSKIFQRAIYALSVIFFATLLGCTETAQLEINKSANLQDLEKIASAFSANTNSISPLKIHGDGLVEYLDDGKLKKESLARVDMILYPKNLMYVSADHTLQNKALRFGTTEQEFWCWARISKVNEYYSGNISQITSDCVMPFGLSPRVIYEALGFVDLQSQLKKANLSFAGNNGVVSVLAQGAIERRYFIDLRNSNIVRIEYFDKHGFLNLVVVMDGYETFPRYSTCAIPSKLTIIPQNNSASISINIKNARESNLPNRKLGRIFSRPKPIGAKKVLRMNDSCEFEIE